jgi:hypothetical protein
MAAINDQVVKLLSLTDGRDGALKFLQGALTALSFYSSDKATAKQLASLTASVAEGRSIMRLGKFTTGAQKLQGVVARASASGWNALLVLEALRVLGEAGYIVGDNVAYMAKYRIVGANGALFAKYGRESLFWGFLFQVILDVFVLINVLAPGSDDAARTTALLNLTKDSSDLLFLLNAVGYVPTSVFSLSAGASGSLLALAGAIGTYQNWNNAGAATKKDNK